MIDRRAVLRGSGAVVVGALAITAVESGSDPAFASVLPALMGNPAETGESLGYPKHLTHEERRNLKTFDELDFVVYSGQQWDRVRESHSENVRAHWPDGHYTDGLARHIEDMKYNFIFAPDSRTVQHPIRVAKDNFTAVTGVSTGTFTRPMPDGNGGFIPPTGKKYAINMVTVGIWNRHGVMDEEFIIYDQLTFMRQLGLA
ncbi:ester cyclase [Streptacidiphilus sp. EB103A]|uniref:ester cyclase n=1 Tax=Streptacidiphilus sp. EB103A TaxID=3156275 RepID=UPI003512F114